MRKEKVFSQSESLALAQRNENQFKTIRELKEKNKELVESGEEMGREITHLKRVIAGQKGKIKQLANEVEKWKMLEKEGKADSDKLINGLLEQNGELKDEVASVKAALERYTSLPWYRKLFHF